MVNIGDVQEISFPIHSDARGNLVVVEGGENKQLPFMIKRVFYIYGTDAGAVRGKHANKHSEFCLINVSGYSRIKIIDCTGAERECILEKPYEGLYIPAMLWKEMYDFSQDSILLIMSSEHYDKSEYINNFEDFLSLGGN